MIIKIGNLKVNIGKKPAPVLEADEATQEYKATMADVLDPEGLLVPNNKFAGMTIGGIQNPDPIIEASRRSQEELVAKQLKDMENKKREIEDREKKEYEDWKKELTRDEIKEINRQHEYARMITAPCPECGSEFECMHKAIKKFRSDYGQ